MVPTRSRNHQTLNVANAELLLGVPSFALARRRREGAKGVGIRYENKVQKVLQDAHRNYVASPWFQYRTEEHPNRINYVQPDGLLFDLQSGIVTIVEIKYNHTPDAYFQLLDKYVPVLEAFLQLKRRRLWRIAVVEVCRWYDSAVAFPCKVVRRDSILAVRPNEFAIHVCRP